MSGCPNPTTSTTTNNLPELFQNFSLQDRQPDQSNPRSQHVGHYHDQQLRSLSPQPTGNADDVGPPQPFMGDLGTVRELTMEEVLITKLSPEIATEGVRSCGGNESEVLKLTFWLDAHNEWGTGGLGGVLFPAAREFIRFFSQRQFHGYFDGKRVLELGSGVGAVGMTLLLLGAQHVSLTDLEAMLPLLHLNFKYNFNACVQPITPVTLGHSYLHPSAICPYHIQTSASSSSCSGSGSRANSNWKQSVSILPLRWGSVLQAWGSYDLIIGSDVIYDLDGFHHLLMTVLQFSHGRPASSTATSHSTSHSSNDSLRSGRSCTSGSEDCRQTEIWLCSPKDRPLEEFLQCSLQYGFWFQLFLPTLSGTVVAWQSTPIYTLANASSTPTHLLSPFLTATGSIGSTESANVQGSVGGAGRQTVGSVVENMVILRMGLM